MKPTIAASLALASIALSAPAMSAGNDWYVTPNIGAVLSDDSDFDLGPAYRLGLGKDLNSKWSVEASLGVSELDVTGEASDYERMSATVGALYFPWERLDEAGRWSPYALASLGVADIDFLGTSNHAPTLEMGAGVLRTTSKDWLSLRGEIRYMLDDHEGKDAYDTFYQWALYVGMQINFGGGAPVMPAELEPEEEAVEEEIVEEELVAEEVEEEVIEDDAPLVLPAVTFPLDSAQLNRDARSTLDEIAEIMDAQPDMNVVIYGHADDTGPSDYNYKLSMRRAEAVKDYLVDAGVAEERLSFQAEGEGRPIASNASDDGRQRNRRVEFHVE